MSHAAHAAPFPKIPLYSAITVVVASLMLATVSRIVGLPPDIETAPVMAQMDLRFADRADGSVLVTTADGREISVAGPGTNGFLRGTMRGLARGRMLVNAGAEVPFHLTSYANGRLTLDDPVTGRRIDLEAFGPTNSGVFAEFLKAGARP